MKLCPLLTGLGSAEPFDCPMMLSPSASALHRGTSHAITPSHMQHSGSIAVHNLYEESWAFSKRLLLLHHAQCTKSLLRPGLLAAYSEDTADLKTSCSGLRLLGVQVPDEAATAKKQAEADEAAKKEGKDQAEPVEPQTKSQPREEWDWAVQNDAKPLWTRSAREVRCP